MVSHKTFQNTYERLGNFQQNEILKFFKVYFLYF